MWYSFEAQWPNGTSYDAGGTRLTDHEMARRYARLVICELKLRSGYDDPEIKMIVKDSDGDVIHILTF